MSFLQRRFDCVVVVGVVKRRPNHAKAAMFRCGFLLQKVNILRF